MKYKTHIHVVVIIVALVAASITHERILAGQRELGQSHTPMKVFDIPRIVAGYEQEGEDTPIDEHVIKTLETSVILTRMYKSSTGWPVQLSIVYAGATRRSLHFPEICIVGHGWEIQHQETVPIGVFFTARRLVMVKGGQREAIIYFFKTGDHMTANYFLNAWHWSMQQLSRGTATSAMIKFSTPITEFGEEKAFSILEDIASKFSPILMDSID